MATTATFEIKGVASETLDLSLDNVTDPDVQHANFGNGPLSLGASSTPVVTEVYSDQLALTAGTVTIDLTALPRGNLPNLDLTGLKVQAIKFFAASANTAAITIADGATNGYNVLGDASGQVTLGAGGEVGFFCSEFLDDVATADATIDVTSSDVDAIFDVLILAG